MKDDCGHGARNCVIARVDLRNMSLIPQKLSDAT